MKFTKVITQWRVIILLFFILFSLVAIFSFTPHFVENGVAIRSVQTNSPLAIAGMTGPTGKVTPLARELIISINNIPTPNLEKYNEVEKTLIPNSTVLVQTTKQLYTVKLKESPILGARVSKDAVTNLRKGLDLEGGTRVVLKPTEQITDDQLQLTIQSLSERLNVYGLSDVVIRPASDLSGDQFIIIEIAGVTEDQVSDLIASQGKFEAKITNQSVFAGGKKDITYVCRTAECSGLDPSYGCSTSPEGSTCRFFFSISLSSDAAQRQADLTKNLKVISGGDGSSYLSDDIVLYLDDVEVDRLKIGSELRGRASTTIQISGSGTGRTELEARQNTLDNMKRLQTVIFTGSLPVKLDVVKLDTISPNLGDEFLKNVLLVGALATLAVALVVIIRYRRPVIVIPMIFCLLSEVVMLLGFAALVGWQLDLIAIAAIIIVIGTGINHLVIISDEVTRGEQGGSWVNKTKAAIFIITGAYLTNISGLIPLMWAGAGLLKGFAVTTIAGLSFGVLIARPAYAAIIRAMHEDGEK